MEFEISSLLIAFLYHAATENFLQVVLYHLAHQPLTNTRQRWIGRPSDSGRAESQVVAISGNCSHNRGSEPLQADAAQKARWLEMMGSWITALERDVASVSLDRGI